MTKATSSCDPAVQCPLHTKVYPPTHPLHCAQSAACSCTGWLTVTWNNASFSGGFWSQRPL